MPPLPEIERAYHAIAERLEFVHALLPEANIEWWAHYCDLLRTFVVLIPKMQYIVTEEPPIQGRPQRHLTPVKNVDKED